MKKIEEVKIGASYFYVVHDGVLNDESLIKPFTTLAQAVADCEINNVEYQIMGESNNSEYEITDLPASTNFVFMQSAEMYLTLYSANKGKTKLFDLAQALKAAEHSWSDEGLFTFIVISNLVGSEGASNDGFGIFSGSQGGVERFEEITIDTEAQLVNLDGITLTYSEFIADYA